VRDIPRSTFAHQDEARFIPLSAGNGELILLTYLRGPKGLTYIVWQLCMVPLTSVRQRLQFFAHFNWLALQLCSFYRIVALCIYYWYQKIYKVWWQFSSRTHCAFI